MDASKKYIKEHDIIPTISFKDGKVHVVKIIQDRIKTISTDRGDKEGVAYKVMEGNEVKRFFTSSDSLIVALSNVEEGETVQIQMKSRKTKDGFINYYEVEKVQQGVGQATTIPDREDVVKPFPKDDGEIPIIEDVPGGTKTSSDDEEIPF